MSDTFHDHVDRIRRETARIWQAVGALRREFETARFHGAADQVRAHVDYRGRLLGIDVEPRAVTRGHGDVLGRQVVGAVTAAREAAEAKVRNRLREHLRAMPTTGGTS